MIEVFSCANSAAPKKYHLFLMMGPPSEPPQLILSNGAFSCAGPSKQGGQVAASLGFLSKYCFAFRFLLRRNPKKLPWKSFEPLLVAMVTTPPADFPVSAPNLCDSTT